MQNKIIDLKNHLYAQLERLGDEEMTPEQLETEIKRTEAITDVSKELIKIFEGEIEVATTAMDNGYDVHIDKMLIGYDG